MELTILEQEFVRVQDELRQCSAVRVIWESRGDVIDGDPPVDARGTEDSASLDQSLYKQSIRFSEIGSQWETVGSRQFVAGEFFLIPLTRAAHEDPPDFTSLLYSDDEERIGKELRVIDTCAMSGNGMFTAIRLQPGVTSPEIWFSDDEHGLWKMDVDYKTYLDLLRLTKGAFSWQHLFTQAPLEEWEFQGTANRLVRILDTLPQLFPDGDYAPLRERLEARR